MLAGDMAYTSSMKKFIPLIWLLAITFTLLAYADHHARQRDLIKQELKHEKVSP